jgi:hypothetical protein
MTLAPQKIITQDEQPAEYVPYNERWTTVKGFDVKVKATPADLARKILNHNQSRGFTSVLEIGESGSGKDTVGQRVRHELHQKHPYVLKFYYGEDVLHIKEIVKKLPKHRDYILWFNDISFLIKKGLIKEDNLMETFHELTKVRHTVKGSVIAFFVIHYPYAVEKFLRQAAYRIITSISDDQRKIYSELYSTKTAKMMIDNFIRMDRFQTEEGHFYLPDRNGNSVKFATKDPFKVALASRMGDLTYLVYDRISCDVCSAEKKTNFEAKTIMERYQKSPKRFMRVTKWVGYILGEVSLLSRNDSALYNWWMDYMQDHNISLAVLVKLLKEVKELPKDERDAVLLSKLQKMEQKSAELAKGETVPEKEMIKDELKEPAPEDDEDDEDEDNDFEDSMVLSGNLDHDGEGLAFDPLDQNNVYLGEDGEQ